MAAVGRVNGSDARWPALGWRNLCVVMVAVLGCLTGPAVASAAPTVVSFTFDDGQQTQFQLRNVLASHGMRATFYVNSAVVGADTNAFRMPWERLEALASDGHEISGHTAGHVHLTGLTDAQQHSEICGDRAALLNRGFFPVASFAYPYGEFNATSKALAAQCGYTSARKIGALRGGPNCGDCPFTETLPPKDAFATRTVEAVDVTTTLARMQQNVTDAEANGGGWVQFLIHGICDGCGDTAATTKAQVTAFLDWLQPRAASGTVVRTVAEAVGAGPSGFLPPPTADRTAPSVDLTAPAPGATVAGTAVPLTANASDAGGVDSVEFLVDGAVVGRDVVAPFTSTWDSTTTTKPSVVVTARATDLFGNVATSPSRTVTVNNPAAPVVAPPVSTSVPATTPVVPPAVVGPRPLKLSLGAAVLRYSRAQGRFVLTFTANMPANLKVTLERVVARRYRPIGKAVRKAGKAGANRVIVRARAARPGRYRVTLTARTPSGQSAKLIKIIKIR